MDKLEFLARMLNRRTNGKAYENMIVNAIYNGVGNPDLIPVTQQYVLVDDNGHERHHLLDLYFPQLNYGIEVDEDQHMNDAHIISDMQRAENIVKAIKCEEFRIKIFQDNHKPRSYDEVWKDVNMAIDIVKQKIQKLSPLYWEMNEERKQKVFDRRLFLTSDDVDYSGITEIYNQITGKNVSNLGRGFVKLNDKYQLWCPNLLLDENKTNKKNPNWSNFLSEDTNTITEYDLQNKSNGVTGSYAEPRQRVVFMRMKDKFGLPSLRFVGVYEAVKQEVVNGECRRTYQKVDKQYKY